MLVPQIKELYEESVIKIRNSNKWNEVRPAFTCDLWRSRTRKEYFTLTMHWIDVSGARGATQWTLRNRILGSIPVQAATIDHKGERAPPAGRAGTLSVVPPAYYAHLAAVRARLLVERDTSDDARLASSFR